MELEFVGEDIPEPSRSSFSEDALAQLQANPGQWARLAAEEEDLTASTVRSRGVALRQYVNRRNIGDNLEISERTIDGLLSVYARWVETEDES